MTYEPPGGPPPPPQPAWQPPPMGVPYPATAYGTPGYGYTPAVQAKPLKGLATAVSILLAVSALAAVFTIVALLHRASVIDDIQNNTFSFSFVQDAQDADDQAKAGIVFLELAVVAAGVVWMIWQYRFAKNAQGLRGSYGLAPGWAIGGWFIPIAWWVLPQLQLFQAAKASDPDIPPGQPAANGRVPAVVTAWWTASVLAGLLFLISSSMRPNKNDFDFDIDRFARADRVGAFAGVVAIAAAVIAILMVRTLTERQTRAMASAPAAYQQPYQQPHHPLYQQQWPQPPQPPQQWQQPAAPPPPQTWDPPPPNQTWQPPPPSAPPPT